MITINDVNDLVRILREQPEWAETIRSILLSQELLTLPQRFAEFVEITGRNFQLVHDRLGRLENDVAVLKTDMAGIRGDLAPIKGAHAKNGALQATRRIARTMNCRETGILNDDDLYEMLQVNDVADLEPGDLRSFENTDIVIRAQERDTAELLYLAVEASFTAHPEDTRRAARNARYLTRFTGNPAIPVVASVHIHPSAQPDFDSGAVRWYEIEAKHIEPD